MNAPDDDWQKRIENGGTWDRASGYPGSTDPAGADPIPQHPGAATPGAAYPQAGPVYGAPGTGPGYPPGFAPQGLTPSPGFSSPTATQQFAAVPGYGYAAPDPDAPFGRDPITGEPLSDKSKVAAGLLQILLGFVGVCGVGRLYIGSTGIGLAQMLLFWLGVLTTILLVGILIVPAVWLWALVDGILMLAGNTRDARGLRLRN